jgi:hypothetical protein
MRILPVNYINYQSKINNCKPVEKRNYQQSPLPAPETPSFKSGRTLAAAGLFGAILGGAALVFAAPVAVVLGAAATGVFGGAAMSDDDEPLNDVERYKYTHEC